MIEVILKQKLSGIIGLLLGGVFLAWFGVSLAMFLNNVASIIPAIFSVLGIKWIVAAAAMFMRRIHLSIRLSPDGIELPTGTAFRPIRRYCSIKTFLALCRETGFPLA